MKKLLLSVAVLATTVLTASAATGFELNSVTYPGAVDNGSGSYTTSTNITDLGAGITVNPTASAAELSLAAGSFITAATNFKISDISFSAASANAGGSARTSWKIYPNYVAANTGSGTPTAVIPTTSGEVLTVILGNSATAITYDITGATPASIASPSQASGADPATYTLTATGTEVVISLPNKARVYAIKGATFASVKNAISAELLNKAGNELVNPTNLDVTIYAVGGAKVLKSSEASINLSGLASGQYVAVTAQGNLKFIK